MKRTRLLGALTAALLAATSLTAVATPAQAADESITVNFSVAGGSPTYRASGMIYGMTEDASGPATNFYTDIKFRAMRAGGAQLDNPGGWVAGRYDRRWNATRAQMLRTRALGGTFILLPHDLWGADGTNQPRYPGDNNNWTDYDNFLTRVIADVRATGVPVQWDIWNEPDITLFWNRPQSQYLELWRRTYQRLRAEMPGTLISGPSSAYPPGHSGGVAWQNTYLDFIRSTNTIPDIFSWHALPSDPVANVNTMNSMLNSRGIAHPRPYQINEYASPAQQNVADGAWYIARLERAGADGLRAHWGSAANLHNDMAQLLIRNSAGVHQPKGEWWMYRFYGSMTGNVVSTTPSPAYDLFATKATGNAKVLVGGSGTTGNIAVNLQRLDTTAGIVQNNQVRILVERIPNNNGGAVAGPITHSNTVVTLSNNGTVVNLPHTAALDQFTITVLPPGTTTPPPTGSYERLTNRHSNLVLDVAGISTADGANIHQWQYLSGANQQWQLQDAGSGYVRIVARHSGKCLDVSGISTADGANVHQWTCINGAQNQQWQLVATSGGFYTVRARHSGKCLEVSAFSTANGGNIQQWACTGTNSQQWSRSAA